VTDWLRQALGLPQGFSGVIQDTASTATLAAVLTMRERALQWRGNSDGLSACPQVRVYCSSEVHSSIDRAIWVSGIGERNLVKIAAKGPARGIDIAALRDAIVADRAAGLVPAGIVACVGGTAAGGCDDVAAICALAREFDLYVHVDAAWAGSAMICDEFRLLWQGAEQADSIVVNPHKWLGAQFDCTVQFLRDPALQVRTLAIRPSYLETQGHDGIVNFSEWGVPLGRRFRALKLWFLLRAHGLDGLCAMIRNHVEWTREAANLLAADPRFGIVTQPFLSLFTFRLKGHGAEGAEEANRRLLAAINDDGRIYLTQTVLDGAYVLRMSVGQFETAREDVLAAVEVIRELAPKR
jgi:aromatic-L-amino-acid decarboxylase